jgi:CRP-like cAMP-binding protein
MEHTSCANLLDSLDPAIKSELTGIMQEVSFKEGDRIFDQDDQGSDIYIVLSGQVKVIRVTPDGQEMILCVLGPSGLFCPLALVDRDLQLGSSQAITDVTLLCAKATDFHQFCDDHPHFANTLMKTCLYDMRQLVGRLEALTFQSLQQRLISILLNKSIPVEIGSSMHDEIHLTQQELAQLAGATRESVSNLLSRWEREGMLAVKRRRVIILRRDMMEQLAAKD